MSAAKQKGYSISYFVKLAIMLLLMFGFGSLPPMGQMNEVGMKVLGTFIGLLFGWSCLGIILPCFVGFVALSFSGIASPSELTMGCFGSEVVILLVAMYAIIDVMNQSGVNDYLVNRLLSIKALAGHPWIFTFIIIFACYISGIIVGGFVAMLLIWGIVYQVAAVIGAKPFDPYPTCLMIGTTIAGTMSAVVFPFLNTGLFLTSSYTAMTETPVDYARFMLFSVPAAIFIFICFVLIMRFIFRINVDGLKNADIQSLVDGEKVRATTRQKTILGLFLLLMLAMLLPSFLPADSTLCILLDSISNTGKVLLLYAIMSVIKIDSEPLMNVGKALKNSVQWEMVIMVGFISQLATYVGSNDIGIKNTLAEIITPVITGSSGLFFSILVLALCMIATNFMNNGPVAIIMMSIVMSLGSTMDANVTALCMSCILFSQIAYATPIASPFAAMLFSNTEWVKPKDLYKYGGISTAILIVCCIVFALVWGNLIF